MLKTFKHEFYNFKPTLKRTRQHILDKSLDMYVESIQEGTLKLSVIYKKTLIESI